MDKRIVYTLIFLSFSLFLVSQIHINNNNSTNDGISLKLKEIQNDEEIKTLNCSAALLWSYDTDYYSQAVAISENGEYCIAGRGFLDGNLSLFHKSSSTPLWTFEGPYSTYSVDISADGNYIVGGFGPVLCLFDKSSSTPIWWDVVGDDILSAAISSDGNYIVAGGFDNILYCYHRTSSTPEWTYNIGNRINSVAISAEGMYITVGSSDKKIYFFDRISENPWWGFNTGDIVEEVAISSDGKQIVGGSNNNKVHFFKYTIPTPIWNYTTGGDVTSVDISSSGNDIVAGSYDEKVYYFKNVSSTPKWSYDTGDWIRSVAISSDGSSMVAGNDGGTNCLFLFHRSSGIPLYAADIDLSYAVAISSNGSYFISGGSSLTIGKADINFFQESYYPKAFTLTSNAKDPDVDGNFTLNWGSSLCADNYTVYRYNKLITEINESLDTIEEGITGLNYNITNEQHGVHYYIISSNNTWGYNHSNCISVNVDLKNPAILINSPVNNTLWKSRPSINVTVWDDNFDRLWYKVGNTKIPLTNHTEQLLDLNIWNGLPEGNYKIYFYANDTGGNLNDTFTLDLKKDTKAPSITINTPLNNTYWESRPSINITVWDLNFDELWYKIGSTIIPLTNNTEQLLDLTIWSDLPEGLFQVEIFANDTLSQTNDSLILTIYKDTSFPLLAINSPENDTLWKTRPSINVTVWDANLDTIWYKVGSMIVPLTNHTEQLLDLTLWNGLPEGLFQLEIFANDSFGHLNDTYTLNLSKDTIAPSITINAPINNTYWETRPSINVTVWDANFDELWYKVGSTIVPLTNHTEQLLDFTTWNGLPEGPFQVEIFANDTLSQINDIFALNLYKDTLFPLVSINFPGNDTIWKTRPSINATVWDANLDTIWYKVGSMIVPLTNHTEQLLDLILWNGLPEGLIYVELYANDSFGHLNDTYTLNLSKDTIAPSITINAPINNTYWETRPSINVTVWDANFDELWYKVGSTIVPLTNHTEQLLDFTTWNGLPEGPFQVEIFANDTLSQINDIFALNLYKDTLFPLVSINFPGNDTIWKIPPLINVTVRDANFDELWYKVGSTIVPLTNHTEQFFDLTLWNWLPEGLFYVELYANDSFGHLNDTYTLNFFKDTKAPSIAINAPINNTYWETRPSINVTVWDPNFDELWYRIGITIIPLTNHTEQILDITVWNGLSEGPFQVEIFANDTVNNVNNTYIIVLIKDCLSPQISIISPISGKSFSETPPTITISIVDASLNTTWYTISGFLENFTFKGYSGINYLTINRTVWDNLTEGEIVITIYSNDTFSRIGQDQIVLLKELTSKEGNDEDEDQGEPFNLIEFLTSPIGLILVGTIAFIATISIIVAKKRIYRSKAKERRRIESLWD